MSGEYSLQQGAMNLLNNCVEIKQGARLLLVCEDPELGWYDEAAPHAVLDAAKNSGIHASTIQVAGPEQTPNPEYNTAIADHDTIIYFARIGDQDRFSNRMPDKTVAMIYARDAKALGSSFGCINHRAMRDFKEAINTISLSAIQIEVTCPLGTQLICPVTAELKEEAVEVSVRRFPLNVPQPVLAAGANGQVALTRWLTPTGSRHYHPAICRLEGVLMATVENGRITNFDGSADDVNAVREHYRIVSGMFDIDPDCIHSWHAGIHPGCGYDGKIDEDPDRWSNNIFGNPKYLHFHTCGNYAPGEICWMVKDPTIRFDGVPLWEAGELKSENFQTASDVLSNWPELAIAIGNPVTEIGI